MLWYVKRPIVCCAPNALIASTLPEVCFPSVLAFRVLVCLNVIAVPESLRDYEPAQVRAVASVTYFSTA